MDLRAPWISRRAPATADAIALPASQCPTVCEQKSNVANLLNLKGLRHQENWPLERIARVELVKRNWRRRDDGGMQHRFRVVCDDGSYALFQLPINSGHFVPKGLEATIVYLNEVIDSPDRSFGFPEHG